MKKLLSILALMALSFAGTASAMDSWTKKPMPKLAMEGSSTQEAAITLAKPVTAIMFFSQQCTSCKILDPRMKKAMQAVNQNKINVVTFDFSNRDAIAKTKADAQENGLGDVLQKYGAKTGYVVLLNSNGQEIDKIKVGDDEKEIAHKLTNAIIASL